MMLVLGLVDIPWWGVLLIAVVSFLIYDTWEFDYFKKQGIPGPRPVPILGTLTSMFTKALPYVELEAFEKYGDRGYYGMFLGTKPMLVVYDADMLSEITVKQFPAFINRSMGETNSKISDNFVANMKDAHWKHVRNEMSPTFTTGKLKRMNSEINRCARALADSLLESAKAAQLVEAKEYAGGYTMDVIASTAFGIRVESQKDRNNAFVVNARRAMNISPTNIPFMMLFLFPKLTQFMLKLGFTINLFPKDIRDFFTNITKQTMEMRAAQEDKICLLDAKMDIYANVSKEKRLQIRKACVQIYGPVEEEMLKDIAGEVLEELLGNLTHTRTDFIQLMMKAQRGESDHEDDETKGEQGIPQGISTDEILANAMLFFVAGFDTTATSLSYFIYNMARYPDVQDKLVKEIHDVIGDADSVDYNLLQNMPYLDQCVNENLRLYPPAIRLDRLAAHDITINGVFIRKGMVVGLPYFAIHRDPKRWPNPEEFNPDRFSPENKKKHHPMDFVPFGAGPRICLAMRLALQEIKVAAIHVLKKVRVSTCEKTQIPIIFEKNAISLLRAEGGIYLKVEARNMK